MDWMGIINNLVAAKRLTVSLNGIEVMQAQKCLSRAAKRLGVKGLRTKAINREQLEVWLQE